MFLGGGAARQKITYEQLYRGEKNFFAMGEKSTQPTHAVSYSKTIVNTLVTNSYKLIFLKAHIPYPDTKCSYHLYFVKNVEIL